VCAEAPPLRANGPPSLRPAAAAVSDNLSGRQTPGFDGRRLQLSASQRTLPPVKLVKMTLGVIYLRLLMLPSSSLAGRPVACCSFRDCGLHRPKTTTCTGISGTPATAVSR